MSAPAHPLELLARVRALLGTARRTESRFDGTVARHPGGTGGIYQVRLELDRGAFDDLLLEIDQVLTGAERDYFLDRETATRTAYALDPQARAELLVDLLAAQHQERA